MHGIRIYQNGVAMKDSSAPITLSEAIDLYISAQTPIVSKHTVRTYHASRMHLLNHFPADIAVELISKRDMLAWRSYLFEANKFENHPRISGERGTLATATIRRIMGTASSMFNWMVEYEILTRNPIKGVKRPVKKKNEPKAISREDFEKLLAAAGEYIGNFRRHRHIFEARDTAIILFLASSGCRVSGLCDAQIEKLKVYEDGAEIVLREKGRGGGQLNTYTLSDRAAKALMDWLEVRPPVQHDYIFTVLWGPTKGNVIIPQTVSKLMRRLEKQAGVKIAHNNPHAFRHALAREMLNSGADLATVRDTLNHSDIRVTARYARWRTGELREKKKKFGYT